MMIKIETEAFIDLADFVLGSYSLVTVSGGVAAGKTTFVKTLIESKFSSKKVAIIEPMDRLYKELKNSLEAIYWIKTNDIDIDFIIDKEIELVAVEEAQLLNNFDVIKNLREKGIKVIIIKQHFLEEDILQLGNHFSIAIIDYSRTSKEMKLSQVYVNGTQYKSIPMYLS